jgi:hypothetical protein
MRLTTLAMVPILAVLAAGCDKLPKMGKADPPAPAAVIAPTTPPAPVEAQAEPAAPAPTEPAAPAAVEAPPPAPPKAEPVRFSRTDYRARERRLAALIANAETRDTSGETQYRAQRGEAERQRCTTKACMERSFAAEEAWMRRWEGSGDVQ